MNAGVNKFSYIFIKWLQRDGSSVTKIELSGCFTECCWMVLVAKGRFFCNQNCSKRLFYSVLMDTSGCKRTVPLQPQTKRTVPL